MVLLGWLSMIGNHADRVIVLDYLEGIIGSGNGEERVA